MARLQMAECDLLANRKQQAQAETEKYLRLLLIIPGIIGETLEDQDVRDILSSGQGLLRRLESQLDIRRAIRNDKLSNKLTFVLGMHRSGTSALAGMLCQMGLDAPLDLMPATDANPKGYWESWEIHLINDRFLNRIGHCWNSQIPLPLDWEDSDAALHWRAELLAHIIKTYKDKDFPLIKDPRFGILISGLDPWLQISEVSPRFLILIRHPLEVAASLKKSEDVSIEEGINLWLLYMFACEKLTRGFKRVFVKFTTLMKKPAKVGKKVADFLVEDFDSDGFNGFSSFHEAIEKGLRHQNIKTMASAYRDVKLRSPVDIDVASVLYELLCKKSSSSVDDARVEIDRLRQLWRRSYRIFLI